MVMSTMADPAIQDQRLIQRDRALQKANEVRVARKELKEQIKAGERTVVDIIESPPAYLSTAPIGDVVMWEPGIGRWRAGKVINGLARMSTPVDRLSPKTRQRIAERLRWLARGGPHEEAETPFRRVLP
jgi:hypothetical protein